jgi:hypothetical protein
MSRLKLTGGGLLLALVVSWPAIQHGMLDHSLAVSAMFIRIGIAVALVMVGQALLASVIDSYRLQNMIRRNREDAAVASQQAQQAVQEAVQQAQREQAGARDQAA